MNQQEIYYKVSKISRSEIRKNTIIGDIDYWPLLKCWIYRFYFGQEKNANTTFGRLIKLRDFFSAFRTILKYAFKFKGIKKNSAVFSSEYILLSFHKHRSVLNNGRNYNKFIDPLNDYLTGKVISQLEYFSEFNYSCNDGVINNEFNKVQFEIEESFKTIFSFLTFNIRDKIFKNRLAKLFKELNVLDKNIPADCTSFLNTVIEMQRGERSFSLLLRQFKTKNICMNAYYFPLQMGFILAAKKKKINTIDFQHASQSKYHYAYGTWKLAEGESLQLLPDEFWVFTDKEKNELNEQFKLSKHKINVVGNLWFQSWKRSTISDKSIRQQLELKDKTLILICFQDFLPDENNKIWNFIRQLKDAHVYFLIRLHPRYKNLKDAVEDKLKLYNINNYEIESSTQWDLFSILTEIDYCCVFSSTVGEEALLFNKKVLIFDELGKLYYEYFISKKQVGLIDNDEKLQNSINEIRLITNL